MKKLILSCALIAFLFSASFAQVEIISKQKGNGTTITSKQIIIDTVISDDIDPLTFSLSCEKA